MKQPAANETHSIWERFSHADRFNFIFITEVLIHEVDAKVERLVDEPIDELERFVLEAVRLSRPANMQQVDELLSLGRQIVFRLCQSFCSRGLLERDGDEFRITQDGESVLKTGTMKKNEKGFQIFHFLHPTMQYLPRHLLATKILRLANEQAPSSNWKFWASTIDELISRDAQWKQASGFPQEVLQRVTHEKPSKSADANASESTPKLLNVTDKAVSTPVIGVASGDFDELLSVSLYPYTGANPDVGVLLSLTDKDDTSAFLSEYLPTPSQDDVNDAWKAVCFRNMLESSDSASVSLEGNAMRIKLSKESFFRWRKFVKNNLQHQMVFPIASGRSWRLYPIEICGANEAASNHLRLLALLMELDASEERERLLCSEAALLQWCRTRMRSPLKSIRELAGFAFDVGEFEIALAVSEMEDMVDAAV